MTSIYAAPIFFEVDTYPEITFKSTGFDEKADGTAVLTGDFLLHGVSKSISFDINHIGHGDAPWGGYRRGREGSLLVKAPDYGIPQWAGDVEGNLVVEGSRQLPHPSAHKKPDSMSSASFSTPRPVFF